jgi:hypothetical protein
LPFFFFDLVSHQKRFSHFCILFAFRALLCNSWLFAFCSLLFARRGTASAEDEDGKHEMKRAPAAITSLSAASRCASRPPSDPSV